MLNIDNSLLRMQMRVSAFLLRLCL